MNRRPNRAAVSALCAATVAAIGVPVALSAAPSRLFEGGFDLCKAASLGAVRSAGGQQYLPGRFDSRVCNWERADLKAGITLALVKGSQATAFKPELMSVHGTAAGPGGTRMHSVKLAGAQAAVIETLPHLNGELSKAIMIVFPQGIVHISMTAPGALADGRLLAIAGVLTR